LSKVPLCPNTRQVFMSKAQQPWEMFTYAPSYNLWKSLVMVHYLGHRTFLCKL